MPDVGVQNCLVVVKDRISQPEGCERVTNGMEMRERDAKWEWLGT